MSHARTRTEVTRWIGILFLVFFVHALLQGLPAIPGSGRPHNMVAIPILGALFCGLDAWLMLGRVRATAFFVIAASLGWTAELLGVHYGIIFGSYAYGDVMGPKIWGVPITIPLFWFMLTYLGYVIANLITNDTPDEIQSRTLPHDIWCSVASGLVVTAYDLGVDPYLASPEVGAWTWLNVDPTTAYFGVPASNFVGWVLVASTITLILRRLDQWLFRHRGSVAKFFPPSHLTHFPRTWARWIALLPVVFYLSFTLMHLGPHYQPGVRAVSAIALGIPAMAALSNWYNWKVGTPEG